MPTVLRQNGYELMIYTDDHRPMHVHIWYQGREVVVWLESEIEIRENNGMTRAQLRRAIRIVESNQEFLRDEWERIYERK